MEQISDWLTKLLVGAGLVELKQLPAAIDSAAQYIAPAMASSTLTVGPALVSVAAAVLIYFSVEGFIGGYIFTRVYFVIVLQVTNEHLRSRTLQPGSNGP
jgi:transcription initiation factor TFIIIB Brf1 subunit/transcription initiation factor TFIIB